MGGQSTDRGIQRCRPEGLLQIFGTRGDAEPMPFSDRATFQHVPHQFGQGFLVLYRSRKPSPSPVCRSAPSPRFKANQIA